MTVNENRSSEPVLCSKCNKLFNSDHEYLDHFNSTHK